MASKIVKNAEKPRMVQILEELQEQLQKNMATVDELMQLVMMDAKYDDKTTTYDWRDDVVNRQ